MIISRYLLVTALAALVLATGETQAQDARFDFAMRDTPKATPDLSFADVDGKPLSLQDFRGKLVLLNVWATWCPPCRKELPSLARLQGELGGTAFQVLMLSTDTGRETAVRRLFGELALDDSGIFIDATGSATRDLGVFGMPTTLLLDGDGNEIGRKIGPAAWDSAAALSFFRELIASSEDKGIVPAE